MKRIFILIAIIAISWNAIGQNSMKSSDKSSFATREKSTKGPLNEGFEGVAFPPARWSMQGNYVWKKDSAVNHTNWGKWMAMFNSYGYSSGSVGYLQTPEMTPTAGDATFSFWVNYYFISGSSSERNAELYVDLSTDNGLSFTNGTTNYLAGITVDTWTKIDIDLSSQIGQNVVLRFRAISDYGSYRIAIDDVSGPELHIPAHDLAVIGVYPYAAIAHGQKYMPHVKIFNWSDTTETSYSITLSDGGSYNETITAVPSVNTLDSAVITFPEWTADTAHAVLQAYVTLAGDLNTANDTLNDTLVKAEYIEGGIYTYDESGDDTISLVDKFTGVLTSLAAVPDFQLDLYSGDYIRGLIYAISHRNSYKNVLFFINGNGKIVPVREINTDKQILEITHDAMHDVVYIVTYDTASHLEILDIENLTTSHVGIISKKLIRGLAAGNNGELWAIEHDKDSLISIDRVTGAATTIGELGVQLSLASSYKQDLGYDRKNKILYGILYKSTGVNRSGIYTIDVNTGAASLLKSYNNSGLGMCAIVATDPNIGFQELERANTFDLYPNPATNMVTIQLDNDNEAMVNIVDLSGRLLHSSSMKNTARISVVDYNPGIYFVKIIQGDKTETMKLIVE